MIFLDPDSIIARSMDYGVHADYNSMLDHVTLYVIFPKRLITFIVHGIFSERRGVIKFSSFLRTIGEEVSCSALGREM